MDHSPLALTRLVQTFFTVLLVIATIATAWAAVKSASATIDYARYQREPNITAYFEADGSWIYLIVQNTGSDLARSVQFSYDLSSAELADIYGPNLHGQRYIVYQDLTFLKHYSSLAPGQRLRHQWLHLPLALRDRKPRPFTFSISYYDRWDCEHTSHARFDTAMFGTWDTAYAPKPTLEAVLAAALKDIHEDLRSLNAREQRLYRRRLQYEAELERAEILSSIREDAHEVTDAPALPNGSGQG